MRVTIWMPSGIPSGPVPAGARHAGNVQAGPDQVEHRSLSTRGRLGARPGAEGVTSASRPSKHKRHFLLCLSEHTVCCIHLRPRPGTGRTPLLAQAFADLLSRVREFPTQRASAFAVHHGRMRFGDRRHARRQFAFDHARASTGQRRRRRAAAVSGSPEGLVPGWRAADPKYAEPCRGARPDERGHALPPHRQRERTVCHTAPITPDSIMRLSDINFMPEPLIIPNVGL